jgi:murein DD-endopeptidase MepM/ murein hydrolase activator NlpD
MLWMLLAAQLAGTTALDSALFPAREAMIRLYTDCDEPRWPGLVDTLIPKTPDEIRAGVARLRDLEARWRAYFAARAGDSIAPTPEDRWVYPLAVRGRLLDNFTNPRENGPHGALDIFVRREGVTVRSPVSGVVVAAGDGWRGGWRRRQGLWYEGGGMSRRQGNGLLLFDPGSGGYFLFSHLQEGVLVRTGDIVRRGQPLGRVGHSGNASQPGRGRHLHIAYKRPGTACGVEGVLVAENIYQRLRAARARGEAR